MSTGQSFLPYGRQAIDESDVDAVAEALRSDYLTTGPLVDRFEAAFATATGAPHAVSCNSGTAALHLAAMASGVGSGDHAVVPSITFLATANVIRMCGAEVEFSDVDPDSGLMTPAHLDAALTKARLDGKRVRLVMTVHLNGQVGDVAALAQVARNHGAELVEDACHALGAPAIGSCTHSLAACFSTHPVKGVTTAEGGVVTTKSEELARFMRQLRSHGMERDAVRFTLKDIGFDGHRANPWHYEMPVVGYNYRLPDVLCALGLSQLQKLPDFHSRRRALATLYDQLLAPLAPVVRPVRREAAPHGWHLYVVLIDYAAIGTTRARFMDALRAEGIGTQVHYIPVHRQPYYADRYGPIELPGADAYFQRCLSIPFYVAMSDADAERVTQTIGRLVANSR